jgi:hypothetical protein
MRLDVVELHALRIEEALERADLIDDAVGELVAVHLHLAPAEALQVGQRRMRADLDVMRLGQLHGLVHHIRVRGMKAAGHIGDADIGHDAGIVAHAVKPEGLAHVAIDRQSHLSSP